ncbi:GNAT family N-acetyltransferase [Halapricum desulfuricans]|uniref:Acetyltransferase (GNAT) family n=1 Tax=Halapricum desulfuricans TaxID=2841257 RepID=A0A897N1N3_9EURY|nr:N-acetyltransferase [Halapricum desulfuricans]QSG06862.1 Acetyltransferase (GNAT) family [Halapricum desulfuricans]
MSINVDTRVVDRGSDEYVGEAWELKERIRRSEGVLRQRRRFFENAYRRSKVYVYLNRARERKLIGFAAVRRDGYVLFLAVDEQYRGEGFGKRLVARVAEDYDAVTCHARTTNDEAISFYQHVGFEIQRRIDDYYEDGGDAYYLKLGEDGSIADRLSRLLGR